MRRLIALSILLLSASCRQADPAKPASPRVDPAAQQRDDLFRWKERCAVAGERFEKLIAPPLGRPRSMGDTEVSEVFYSGSRNSCICETAIAFEGTRVVALYDCLTREQLAEAYLKLRSADYNQAVESWKRKKDALKSNTQNDPSGIR